VTLSWRIIVGDAAQTISTLPAASVQCCVTSPPYFGLRDYGTGRWEGGDPGCDHAGAPRQSGRSTLAGNGHGNGKPLSPALQAQTSPVGLLCPRCGAVRVDEQIGLEDTPDEYVQRIVDVFREVRRVLRDDGTVWLNLGDSYAATSTYSSARSMHTDAGWKQAGRRPGSYAGPVSARSAETAKPKDLLGIPWSVAFALRADGWYLRQEIIWAKTAPMPESVRDRCTRAHEQVFMLSKRPTYFYDLEAIKEPRKDLRERARNVGGRSDGLTTPRGITMNYTHANRRSVWTLGPEPFAQAHFAVMPGKLARDCLLAGTPERCCGTCGAPWERIVEYERWNARDERRGLVAGDAHVGQQQRVHNTNGQTSGTFSRTVGWRASCEHDDPSGSSVVLDPFSGAGTTGVQALRAGRSYVGVELNAQYAELARNRIRDDAPLMNVPAEEAA
jgi:DNA modification methylase